MARFNETMRLKGRYNGKQIVPTLVVAKVRASANKSDFAKAGCAALAGGSYKSQWLINHNAYGAFNARGIHDQTNYVDHKAEMVIVRLALNLQTSNVNFDHLSLPAYQAIAEKLMKAK